MQKPQPLALPAWLQCMAHSDDKEVEAKTASVRDRQREDTHPTWQLYKRLRMGGR